MNKIDGDEGAEIGDRSSGSIGAPDLPSPISHLRWSRSRSLVILWSCGPSFDTPRSALRTRMGGTTEDAEHTESEAEDRFTTDRKGTGKGTNSLLSVAWLSVERLIQPSSPLRHRSSGSGIRQLLVPMSGFELVQRANGEWRIVRSACKATPVRPGESISELRSPISETASRLRAFAVNI
jgi:hypothetical protein